MDLLKMYDSRIAESEERIVSYTRLVEEASTDPDKSLSLSIASRALESELAHKRRMEELRTSQLQLTRRMTKMQVRVWITAIVAVAVAAFLMVLHFQGKR